MSTAAPHQDFERKPEPPVTIIGGSPRLAAAVGLARQVAVTHLPVLIVGETGTGKELLAQLIHWVSGRIGSLVPIDCGALPDDLIESLLFGHRRGSFTGAVEHARGLIVEADHGTLFLDELASLPERGQAKLLRVLESGSVRRVGEAHARTVDFRLVATMQRGVAELLERGRFREDLLQRVAGVVIHLPSLRERGDDVILLAHHFAAAAGLSLDERAAAQLAARDWPGNVRELKWTLARCALFATGESIDERAVRMAAELGPGILGHQGPSFSRSGGLAELRALCLTHAGDPDRLAEALGITRSAMYRRLRKAGLRLDAFRGMSPA